MPRPVEDPILAYQAGGEVRPFYFNFSAYHTFFSYIS